MRRVPIRHAVLGVALALGVAAPVALSTPPSAVAWDADAFEPASELELVELTNRTRAAADLPALEIDPRLVSLARWRSRDMVERSFFSHDLPEGGTVFDVLSRRDYCFRLAGENIGWNTWSDPEATRGIHGMFLESPGHRQNVVGTAWDAIGVGAFKGPDGRKVWTVLFADACGRPLAAALPANEGPTAAPEPRPRGSGVDGAAAGATRVAPGSGLDIAESEAPGLVAALGWLGAAIVDVVSRLVAAGNGLPLAR